MMHQNNNQSVLDRFKNNFSGRQAMNAIWALSILFAAGCHSKKEDSGKGSKDQGAKKLDAEGFVVKLTSLTTQYQSSGNLLPNEEISVFPEISGRITNIYFQEGKAVRKGDLLVQLNDSDIKAQIQKLIVQRKLQVLTKQRQDELLAINGIARQDYDNTVAQIASIDADISYSQTQLRKLQIRASFDGIVGLRNVSVGAIVSTTTLITSIQQINPLKMDFAVPEQYKNIIKNGDQVAFSVTGNLDTLKGTIVAIQPGADATTRTVTMRAMVPNADHKLVPGSFAHVFIPLNNENKAIMIPSQSVIPTTRDKQVAVVKDGKVKMVTVVTGERLVQNVEILNGLQGGDTILTTGIMQVKDGMQVKITKVNN